MDALNQLIDTLSIPGFIATILIVLYLIGQFIGELLELKGKIVPEFFKIRKYFKRKKDEKETQKELLQNVQTTLDEINSHYSTDNIEKRNKWMNWVNERTKIYDTAVTDLIQLKDALESNKELTLDLYININRNRIIDFARMVANEDKIFSREEFNRIFKVYKQYEEILAQYKKKNGEVDIAFKVITEGYQERMKDNSFLEDIRGYNK